MIRYRCDLCGLDLARDGSNHFIVKIEAYAAAGQLEFSEADTRIDSKSEIKRTLAELETKSPDDIEDSVYRSFRYDLCPKCHRKYLASPLSGQQPERP